MRQLGSENCALTSGICGISKRWCITHDHIRTHREVACASLAYRSMLTVVVYLDDYIGHDMWCDAKPIALPFQPEGMVGIYNREHRWSSAVRPQLNCVQFHFPRSHLDQAAGAAEGETAELFQDLPARLSISDPVLKYLALAGLPLMHASNTHGVSYAEQIMDAVIGHVARNYVRLMPKSTSDRDRLAPWQIRKVTKLVLPNISGRISVSALAKACTLSPSHFSYLFKRTTGCTPHQWLLNRRIELAKKLLADTDESIVNIASASGFSDQSHFTRVFSRRVKASPSAWRRSESVRAEEVLSNGRRCGSTAAPSCAQTSISPDVSANGR